MRIMRIVKNFSHKKWENFLAVKSENYENLLKFYVDMLLCSYITINIQREDYVLAGE
jgi:hypothetical protein